MRDDYNALSSGDVLSALRSQQTIDDVPDDSMDCLSEPINSAQMHMLVNTHVAHFKFKKRVHAPVSV